jgi:UDP-N-acetylglucosamine 2-epimerase (non-hydrolysing)
VIDALLWAVETGAAYGDTALDQLDDHARPVLLVTAHRRESWGGALEGIGRALGRIADSEPQLTIVVPVHSNPTVRSALIPPVNGKDNVIVTDPLPYGGFCRLMNRASIVLTDSGGLQEEAPSLGKPVLVMRDTTERGEAIIAGTACLVGTDEERVVESVRTLLHNDMAYRRMANAVNPYGDGHAAGRSVEALERYFAEISVGPTLISAPLPPGRSPNGVFRGALSRTLLALPDDVGWSPVPQP